MTSIGIMTWYKYRNYGTVLQAVALSKALSSLSCKAVNIAYDFAEKDVSAQNRSVPISIRVKNKALRAIGFRPLQLPKREKLFDLFITQNLSFTDQVQSYTDLHSLNKCFDAFICGSDQIWSPRCFDPRFYLDFVDEKQRKIAYAPSFGCTTIGESVIESKIEYLLRSIGSISVRENTGADIVERLTGLRPFVALDPTLLLDATEWNELSNKRLSIDRPYCLMYFLGTNSKNLLIAEKISKKRGLMPIQIPVFERQINSADELMSAIGPAEFISLFRDAQLICTDSFHGVVFSTIFEKEFIAFERFRQNSSESQNTRIYEFLDTINCRDVLLNRKVQSSWELFSPPSINYEYVSDLLRKKRDGSFHFIKKSIQNTMVVD